MTAVLSRAPAARAGGTPTTPDVALRGSGCITSIGTDPEQCFSALLCDRTGRAPLQVFDAKRFGTKVAYEIQDRPDGVDQPGRAGRLLADAVEQAAAVAGLDDLGGVPVLVGTGLREMRSAELAWLQGRAPDPLTLDLGSVLSRQLGADDVQVFSNACSASLYALGLGQDLLKTAHVNTVVVAGVDVLTSSMVGLLDRVHLDPPEAVRPFDRRRKGVILGEGAAAVVLTTLLPARQALRAVALGCDAFHVTAPDPAGIERVIRDSHAAAGISPGDVDVIFAHGTGTVLNDAAEALALGRVFGGVAVPPPVVAVKAATGHTSGGSGLFSLIMALESLRSGAAPGLTHLVDPLPEAQGLLLSTTPSTLGRRRIAQVNAFGFGGLNAVAIVEQEPGR